MSILRVYWEPILAIGIWYFANVSTVILNKYIYQFFDFKFPFTLTAIHMGLCSLGAYVFSMLPESTTGIPHQKIETNGVGADQVLCRGLFCFNIVLGNISLRWIPVSFMQTIKSAVPACTVLFQYLRGDRLDSLVYMSLIPIVGGVMLATFTEANFNAIGFWTAAVASFVTAGMAIVTGMLLTTKLNPVSLLYYMAPASFVMLLPFTILYELPQMLRRPDLFEDHTLTSVLFISGAIAFLLNVSSFFVIQKTSALTFTVSGNFKVVLSIVISVLIFKNQITYLNGIGCAAAVLGCFWYSHLRMEANKKPTLPISSNGTATNISSR